MWKSTQASITASASTSFFGINPHKDIAVLGISTYHLQVGIHYKVNESFFDSWTPAMAYVLGYWYADGNLEYAPKIRGHYIRVVSTDKDRIEAFKFLLRSEHTIFREQPAGNAKPRYILRIGNRKLFDQLSKIGMTPHKSLTMLFPDVPTKYLPDFIRGYLDGDGCVFLEMRSGITQEKVIKKLLVAFTSGSKSFLESLNHMLAKEVGTRICPYTKNGENSYQLRYNTKDSLKLFRYLYQHTEPHLYLSRKYAIFVQYFKLRPTKIDSDIAHILKYQKGLVAK